MRTLFLMLAALCIFCASPLRAGDEFAEIQKQIVSFKLENGLTIILYRRGDAPVISCVTHVQVGSTDERTGITGIAHQLEHLAFKGTPNIGTKDFSGEARALAEIDALQAKLLAAEERLPAELRDPLLALLAQASTTGAANIENAIATQASAWRQTGVKFSAEDEAALVALVRAYAEKVKAAEHFAVSNEYADVLARNGGTGLNAYTTDDFTGYHVSLPANKLELWASLESDRFMNTVPRQLEKEKQVVLEERRMRTDSNADGKLEEVFLGMAFMAHPYGRPVIGYRSDILHYTRENVLRFYHTHYVPSRAYVAVVGDIDVDAARKLLSEYFGKIPSAPEPELLTTVEPRQEGERRVEIEFPAQPRLLLGYHVPEYAHPDTPALEVLDAIATSERTSRLYTRLVKTKKANSVGSWLGPGQRYPRLLNFDAEPCEGVGSAELETMLLAEIENLKTQPPSTEELQRVVTQYRAEVLRGLKSNLGLAEQLADYQALTGDWHDLFRDIEIISAVKPADVTAVAAKYLARENRTVGVVVTKN